MFRGVCRFLTLGLSQQHCEGNFCAQSFFVLPFGKKEMFSIIARYFIPFYLSLKSYNRIKITIQMNVLHKSVFGSRLQFQTYIAIFSKQHQILIFHFLFKTFYICKLSCFVVSASIKVYNLYLGSLSVCFHST